MGLAALGAAVVTIAPPHTPAFLFRASFCMFLEITDRYQGRIKQQREDFISRSVLGAVGSSLSSCRTGDAQ